MAELPESVRPFFAAAGWFPGRQVAVPPTVPAGHPAAVILAEFGGLTVSRPGSRAGEVCGTSELNFRRPYPDLSVLGVWAGLLGTNLVGIAEVDDRHAELYVSTDGRVFGRSCIHDAFYFVGSSFAEAIERKLFGRRSRPMLRPDQSEVRLYGIRFTRESSEIYYYG